MEWSFSLDNINKIAKEFWHTVNSKTVFAFHGKMGAGKTTFIHALCDAKAKTVLLLTVCQNSFAILLIISREKLHSMRQI